MMKRNLIIAAAAATALVAGGAGWHFLKPTPEMQLMLCEYRDDGEAFVFNQSDSRPSVGTPSEGECFVVVDEGRTRRRYCDAGDYAALCHEMERMRVDGNEVLVKASGR